MKQEFDSHEDSARLARPLRKLSSFQAEEFLFDYLEGRLDADRAKAMESVLTQDEALNENLTRMKGAAVYLEALSQTRISEKHLQELQEVKRARETAINKAHFAAWPEPMRWAAEAMLVSLVVAFIALLFPWAEMSTNFSGLSNQLVLNDGKKRVESVDVPALEELAETASQIANEPNSEAPTDEKKSTDNKKPTPVNSSGAAAKPTLKVSEAAAQIAPIADESIAIAKRSSIGSDKKGAKGLLYRLQMKYTGTEKITPAIREKILDAGGAKAGEVELGWRKTDPPGNYFHFTLSEQYYQSLLTTLGAYGPVRIFKQPHERVMPEGKIRIILWIEDDAATSAPAEPQTLEAAPAEVPQNKDEKKKGNP